MCGHPCYKFKPGKGEKLTRQHSFLLQISPPWSEMKAHACGQWRGIQSRTTINRRIVFSWMSAHIAWKTWLRKGCNVESSSHNSVAVWQTQSALGTRECLRTGNRSDETIKSYFFVTAFGLTRGLIAVSIRRHAPVYQLLPHNAKIREHHAVYIQ